MMNREVFYEYFTTSMGCECCYDSGSYYELRENGSVVSYGEDVGLFSDEQELRREFAHLEPFSIHPESQWF